MIEAFKDQKEVQMIIFKLGNESYSVPILSVQEIIMPRNTTHIPRSPSWVEGVINLRGKIIPVIDGKKKFQLNNFNQNNANTRIIVLDIEDEIIGLIVDEVSEVIHLKTEDIEPTPLDTETDCNFILGVGKYMESLLILINPQKFLSHIEVQDLKNLAKVTESIQQTKVLTETNAEI